MDFGCRRIGHTIYASFSCLKYAEGGMSKKDAIALLKEHGIKVTAKDAYSPYVGQYGLWVEASKQDEASKLLF